MSQSINQRQPFVVIDQPQLTSDDLIVLTQLYQPIIGGSGLSLYQTLAHLPGDSRRQSDRYMHGHLIDLLMLDPHQIHQAREELEAMDLLATYRDTASSKIHREQTLYYQLKKPLSFEAFIGQPAFNGRLFQRINDRLYQQLIQSQLPTKLEETELKNISVSFSHRHQNDRHVYIDDVSKGMANQLSNVTHQKSQTAHNFDYVRFIEYLTNDTLHGEAIDYRQFTEELKTMIFSLYDLYQFTEQEAARIVHLSKTVDSQTIQIDQIPKVAERLFSANEKPTETFESSSSLKQRQEDLLQNKALTQKDIELILMTEQMPPEVFLEKTKQAKGGFAESNERYYVNQLMKKIDLPHSMINLIIYQLLILEGQPSVYRSSLERHANQLLQSNIQTIEQAVLLLKTNLQKTDGQNKLSGSTQKPKGRGRKVYVERLPDWMTEKSAEATPSSPQDVPSEEDIRSSLERLLNQEGDER